MLKSLNQFYAAYILVGFLARDVMLQKSDCLDTNMRLKAAVLASSCCTLVWPTLDKGYNDCVKELSPSLPKTRQLTSSEKLAINICVEECNYIGNGYIDVEPPYNMDFDNIEDNIQKFLPEPKAVGTSFLLQAFKKCQQFCENHKAKIDIKFPDVDIIHRICAAYAMRITTCVRIVAMQECPSEFYLNTTECTVGQQFFKECMASVTAN